MVFNSSIENVFSDCTQLSQKAKEIANQLDFKASNGWLDRWKKQHSIKRICGESGDVSGSTVSSGKERFPEIVRGYRSGTLTKV